MPTPGIIAGAALLGLLIFGAGKLGHAVKHGAQQIEQKVVCVASLGHKCPPNIVKTPKP